jgi:phosphohistidine phosphatase
MPPVEIYLVRHAIAADRGEEWPDDSKRPLTDRGMSRFKDAVKGLDAIGVAVDEIFTSPLVRAKQTADILSAGLPGKPQVKTLEALAPGNTPVTVMEHVSRTARHNRIALVGHEPGLGELAAHLLGARRPLSFKKGGRAALATSSGSLPRRCSANWVTSSM